MFYRGAARPVWTTPQADFSWRYGRFVDLLSDNPSPNSKPKQFGEAGFFHPARRSLGHGRFAYLLVC
jgi:hypothetical protein